MQKWNIYLNACPKNRKELKDFVMDIFHKKSREKHWVERRNITLRNSTLRVIYNKNSSLELSFRGGQRFLLFN